LGFGFFDSGCEGENFFQPCDVEHGKYAGSDAGESEPDMFVAAIDFVIDNLAHAGRIHERHPAQIEDGMLRRFRTAE
jgi:hypothetical protein